MGTVAILILLALAASAVWASDLSALPSARERAALPADGGPDYNRLIHASSPYLLQHASNPVEWYQWGEEAFARAAAEGKPIFLSVGYSTCHWCHVMARESFEDPEVAALLDQHFVSIKLDREERPDIDHVYMTFVQATTGHGGWPMSVFLTPEREPFYGGTYYPKPQFMQLLGGIATAWTERRDEVERSADRLAGELRRIAAPGPGTEHHHDAQVVADLVEALARQYDAELGGFGPAPKFPRPAVFLALQPWAAARLDQDEARQALGMVTTTLRAMAQGGMVDHLGGGFHRYSVDRFWHVPHFEKMLYDQGQLAVAYVDAWQLTGEPLFAATAEETCAYVLRDLRHDSGALFSAEDADSARPDDPGEHGEGAFYVWTADELREILGEDHECFAAAYGVESDGNVRPESDPHGELSGTNHLIRAQDAAALAQRFGLAPEAVEQRLAAARATLLAARAQRPRPHLDDKILTAWNGLMISGLARTGAALGREDLVAAAVAAADALHERLYDQAAGQLYRVWRDGHRGDTRGFADDHAFLIQGLLDCYGATLDPRHLRWAHELQRQMDQRFAHPGGGWYNTEADRDDVLIRAKEDYDGAEPAASSVAARNCLRLAGLLGDEDLRQRGLAAIHGAAILERAAHAAPALVRALQGHLVGERSLVVVGEREAADTRALLTAFHRGYRPFTDILLLPPDGDGREELVAGREWLAAMTAREGAATAYLCHGRVCQAPTTDPAELARQLERSEP